jgi:transposase
MKLYGAIDLHSTNSVLVVIDEEDKIVYRKRLPNDLALILQELCVYQWRLEGIVVESTYNWYWLVDGLMAEGYPVHLANTAVIQQYEGLKYSNDDSDARWLAQLLRLGILPQGYISPREERAVRDLLRKRSQLVRQRTMNLLSIQNLMTRNTGSWGSVWGQVLQFNIRVTMKVGASTVLSAATPCSRHQRRYDNSAPLAVLPVLPAGGLNNQSSVSTPSNATFRLRSNWNTYGFIQFYKWLLLRDTGPKDRRNVTSGAVSTTNLSMVLFRK